ncbi:hypothetical protein GGS23DRAFT_620030 [Durotheca rogersii]|uniref:uncharacterized protein n=1 Tax=Durotheca rogersii TaxID=419775 RepID=UPI00221E3E82|nr:uncharacterized protein GGS23DRAFT_620030 [Durotheca rogersii]KAI5864201.1 hypothetical protein GGS23DRAFT_620030 [Durotheca rogersii]
MAPFRFGGPLDKNPGGQDPVTPPDSAVRCPDMDRTANDASFATNHTLANGQTARVTYTFGEINSMWATLQDARREGLFPTTTATFNDTRAVIEDYGYYMSLRSLRGDAPPDQWPDMPEVAESLTQITRDIRARDKVAANASESDRVRAHVNNMMSGVNAEARLYSIVQHAVNYAHQNGSGEQATTLTGQTMAALLDGIRGVITEMAGKGTHNVNGTNVDAVMEDVFGVIDMALNENANKVDGQLNRVDGQIMHLDAIVHHVGAIDGHVHSLGNNLNAMSTLLNSTNGNVVSLNTQLGLLQSIVNLLPQMIQQALEDVLPQGIQPIITILEQQLGVALANRIGAIAAANKKARRAKKFSKFLNFFKKPSDKGDRKDGNGDKDFGPGAGFGGGIAA